MNTEANSEASLIWTLTSVFMFVWLSFDFYNSLFHGKTLMLRVSGYLRFEETPLFFIITVAVKLIIYSYFCHYLYKRFLFFINKILK